MKQYSKILIEFLTLKDRKKRSLIHESCYKGSVDVLKLLLDAYKKNDLPVCTFDKYKNTPLDMACIRGFDLSPHEKYEETIVPILKSKNSYRFGGEDNLQK